VLLVFMGDTTVAFGEGEGGRSVLFGAYLASGQRPGSILPKIKWIRTTK